MEARREEVGQQIKTARRLKGFRSQRAFAKHIGIHENSVAHAETGSARIGDSVYTAIEAGLDWPTGSIKAYLAGTGRAPWILSAATATMSSPHEWSAEARQKMISMSVREVLDFVEHERIMRGEAAALLALREIVRIRDEAGAIPVNTELP